MLSFAQKILEGTYCAYEGDQEIFPVVNKLFTGIGGVLFALNKEQKTIYHAAGVMANNYLVSLSATASECYQLAGLDEEIACQITSMFMADALQNIQQSGHKNALTGPLQRGDVDSIKKHLLHLKNMPRIKAVYSALGEATIPLTHHTKELQQILTALLQKTYM